jgi:hypothetical protein
MKRTGCSNSVDEEKESVKAEAGGPGLDNLARFRIRERRNLLVESTISIS